MIRLYLIVSSAMLFAAMAVGCGGSDGTAATATLTKPAFIKAGDAICEKADESQDAELATYVKANPKAEATEAGQIKMVEAAGLPALKVEIEELQELAVPEGDEDAVNAIWKGLEEALAESEKNPSSVLGSSTNPFADVGKLAAKYGFKACNNAL